MRFVRTRPPSAWRWVCALAAALTCGLAASRAAPSPVASPAAPPPAAAGPAKPITLTEAVALGLRENRNITSAYLQRVAQRFDLTVATNRFRPQLNIVAGVSGDRAGGRGATTTSLAPTGTWLAPSGATVAFSWTRSSASAGDARGVADSTSVTLVQPLLRGAGWAVNQAPVRIARLQDQIDRLALKSTVSETVTQIVLAYRTLLQTQEQVRLSSGALDRSEQLLRTNLALIDAGRMAAADILQTRADVAGQRLAMLQAQQQSASAQLAMLRLLSLDLRTNLVAVDKIAPAQAQVELDRAIAMALDDRMDVMAQRKALEQDRENLRLARNDRLWDLSVVAGARRDRPIGNDPGFPDTSTRLGLQLSIPIGDLTLKQAEIRATTTLRLDEVRLDDLRQEVEAQVRDAAQGVDTAWRQVEAAREARDFAAQALQFAGEKLKAGRASNFEVLSFEGNLRAAETQELNAGINYLNALTILDQQVGGTLATWRIDLND